MSDFMSEIPDHLRKERIIAPDDFADSVMERIAVEKAGGLKAMHAGSRILIFAVLVIVYSSLGVFLGIQNYRNFSPDKSVESDRALIEFRDTYHLNPVELHDRIFKPFTSETKF
ncbi:MAG TPA: hypothetical protein VMV74_02645 [Bacteroidales bacterium]|nr:hypothetical protein [Bacteroidales bacterium]